VSKALSLLTVLAVVALAGCGGGGGGGSANREDSATKSNTDLQSQLLLYPGAKLRGHVTTGYTTGGAKITGYQTRYIYGLPASASLAKVHNFYLTQMRAAGWQQVASLTGPVDNYRKGKSFVSVNMQPVPSHRLELLVDKDFFSHVKK
jgi:hypothetical protein